MTGTTEWVERKNSRGVQRGQQLESAIYLLCTNTVKLVKAAMLPNKSLTL